MPIKKSKSTKNILYKLILITTNLNKTIYIQLYTYYIFTNIQQKIQTHPSKKK